MELVTNPISNAATKMLEDIERAISAAFRHLFGGEEPISDDEVKTIIHYQEEAISSLPPFRLTTGDQFNLLLFDEDGGVTYAC